MSKLSLILLRMSQSDVKKEKKKKSKMKLEDGEGSPLRSSNAIELLEGSSNQVENAPSEQPTNEITVSQQSSHESGPETTVKPTAKVRRSSNDAVPVTSFEMIPRSRSASKESTPGTPIETLPKSRRESSQSLIKAKTESSGTKIGEITSDDKIQGKNKKKPSSGKKTDNVNDTNKETGNLSKKSSRILSKTKSTSKNNIRDTEDKKEILGNNEDAVTGKVGNNATDTESKENNTNSVEQKESALTNIIELSSIEEEQPRKLKENDDNFTERSDAESTTAGPATNESEQPKTEDPVGSDNKKEKEVNDNQQPAQEVKLCYSQDQSALETLNTIREILVKLETSIAGNNARRSTCSSVEVQTITERADCVAVAGSSKEPQQDLNVPDDKSFKCDLEKATKGFHFVNSGEQSGAYDKHCKMRLLLSENPKDTFCKDLLEAENQAPCLNKCPCSLYRNTDGPVNDPNYYGLPFNEDVYTDRGSVGNAPTNERRMNNDDQYADSCQKCIANMGNESINDTQFTTECCQKCCLACMGSENNNDCQFTDSSQKYNNQDNVGSENVRNTDYAERCQGCSAAIIGSENISDDQFTDLCQKYLNQVSENINDASFIERCKKCSMPTTASENFRGNNFTETCPKCSIPGNASEIFRGNNFAETCPKCSCPSNGSENFRGSNFTETCPKCSIPSSGSENFRGNSFPETCKKCSMPSRVSSNIRGTPFTETCKKCSLAGSVASNSRATSFSEPCPKCSIAKSGIDNKFTDRLRMSNDQSNEMKYPENDFFNDGYPMSNDGYSFSGRGNEGYSFSGKGNEGYSFSGKVNEGYSFSGKGTLKDPRSNSVSKTRNVRFNEAVDEKLVSNTHLQHLNDVSYISVDDNNSVSSLVGSASYFTGDDSSRRGSLMPAHHRRGTPYPRSSQSRLSPIEDETFVPLEFTASGSFYYEPELQNINYGYDSENRGVKKDGQNICVETRHASEAPLLQLRQYEKPKSQEGKNISYSNCELDNIYLHAKGEMEDVKIFAAGQVKNIRIYAEGQLSNIMMFANGDVDNVEAFTEGDLQSMLTYDDGKEKLEFELIENNIDTISVQDAFARNIFKNKGAPGARKCLKCQDCFNKGSEHLDLCTKTGAPKFNQSPACWFNPENKCVNVGSSANNTGGRTDEEGYEEDMCNWDTNTDILAFDFKGDDYLGKNCSYNSDDSTDVSLASNGNMNKSVNTQMSYANTIKLLRNRCSVRAFGDSIQDSQPQTLTTVYALGVWKSDDSKQCEGEQIPVNNPREENIRGSLGGNLSQPRVPRSKVKFRLGSDNILISNDSETDVVLTEKQDFASVASNTGMCENVAMVTTAPQTDFENNQQFARDGASFGFNVGSKISVDNESKGNPKVEQAESFLSYRIDPIDHSHNVVPFLESRLHPSDNNVQPLLENKFDFFVRNVQSLLQSGLYQLQFSIQTLLENRIDIINYDLKELISHNYDVMYQIDKVSRGPEYIAGDRGDLLMVALDEGDKQSFKTFHPSSDQAVLEAHRPASVDKEVQGIIYTDSYDGQVIQSLDEYSLAQRGTSPKNKNEMNTKSVSPMLNVSSNPKRRTGTTENSYKLKYGVNCLCNKQSEASQTNHLQKSTSNTNNVWLVKNWPSGASRLSGLLTKCTSKDRSKSSNYSNEFWDHNNQKLNDMNEYSSENSETTTESYYGDQRYQNCSDESSISLKVIQINDFPTNPKIDLGQVHPMLQNELTRSAENEAIIDNLSAPDDQAFVMSQDYKSNSFYGRKKIFYPKFAEAIDNGAIKKIQNTFHTEKERKLNSRSYSNHLSQTREASWEHSQKKIHTNVNKNMRLNSEASEGVIEQFTSNENYTVGYANREMSSKPVIYLGIKTNYHLHPRCRISAIEKSNNSKGDDEPAVYNQPSSSAAPSQQRMQLQERVCDCFYNCAINKSGFQAGAQNCPPDCEECNRPTQQMDSSSFNNSPMQCCPTDAVMCEQPMLPNRMSGMSDASHIALAPRMSLNQLQPRKFIMEGRLFISSSLGNMRPDIFPPIGTPAQLAITQAPDIADDDYGAKYASNVGSYQDSSRIITEPEPYCEVETQQKQTQASSPYMGSKQFNRRKSSKSDKKLFFQACLINKRCQMNIQDSGMTNKKSPNSNDPCDSVFRTLGDDVGSGNVRQTNIADTEVVNCSRDFQSSPIAMCTYQDFCGDVATDFCDCLANSQDTKQCNDACTDVDDLVCPSGSGKNAVFLSNSNSSEETSTGTKGSERHDYSAKTSSSSASKRQRRPQRKESSSRSISFKVKVGFSASEDDLCNVDTGRCIKEGSLAYCGRVPPGSKSRVSMVDTDDDNSRKKYHRPASSSDDVCTDDVTTPSDFSAEEERGTRNKTSRSMYCKCSDSKKPRRLSPNSKNVTSRRYSKKQPYEKRDSYDSLKDADCECSNSDISPDRVNSKKSNHQGPSHSQSQKFKRLERRICSKRADSDSNLDSEPPELHCKRCSSPAVDKSRYVDEIGFVRERPEPNRGHKEMQVTPSRQRNRKAQDYEYETDDEEYSTREGAYQKYYYQNRASTSKTCPGRQCQNCPLWSEKSGNASSTIPQRKPPSPLSTSHPTFDRYGGADSKALLCEPFPVKCSNAKESGAPRKRSRTAASNPRASLSTDDDLSNVAGVAGRCPQGCMNQSTAIYNLNHLPRWSPKKDVCAQRNNVDAEDENMYEKIGMYNQEKWDDASQSALYNNAGESKVKRRVPRGFFMYGMDESEE